MATSADGKKNCISVCFAMTIEQKSSDYIQKSRTITEIDIYLPQSMFWHGQLYVAISRVTSRYGLKILLTDEIFQNV
jgi:ATP-dependent DNA helicase PIF1